MPKKKTAHKSKHNKKKTPPSKKAANRNKPARKRRPAARKSPAPAAAVVERSGFGVAHHAAEAEEPEVVHEDIDDYLPPDIGGSE